MAQKVPVSNQDREKSYFKYYMQDVYCGEPEKYAMITEKPMDNSIALTIDRRNDLFLPGDLPAEFGWWILDDGTATIANSTFFPGTTGEMFDWWFVWHPIDRVRYACWDSEDHYDSYVDDPAAIKDLSVSLRERLWGSVHNVWEDAGTGRADLIRISFKRPSELGFDESKIDTEVCSTLVCANGVTLGSGDMPDVPAVMAHYLRPAEGGSVLRSRFWIGYTIIDGQPVKCIPDGFTIPEFAPLSLLNHNIKEFSNLSRILPSIYEEEKDNWF